MKKIILLTGPAYSGKDSTALALRPYGFTGLALASPIRDMLLSVGLVTQRELERDKKEEVIDWHGNSPRRLMQTLGTEWGRDIIHDQIWIKLLARRIEKAGLEYVAVTDVRFQNEVDSLLAMFGDKAEVWHIVRPNTKQVISHVSENGVRFDSGHLRVDNSGTLNDLDIFVSDAMRIRGINNKDDIHF